MKIAILSRHSGLINRGVETWAESLKKNLSPEVEVIIISGRNSFNPFSWPEAIAYIPTNGRVQAIICRLFCWLVNKPMIIFGHSGPGADDKWNLLCSPDIFVCFSTPQSHWARQFKLPWTKIIVIPHAVDLEFFTPSPKKPTKNIILCVAANDPIKRVNLVAQAVKLVPNVEFSLVGSGQPHTVPMSKMPKVYHQAKVFCLVSEPWEAFGLVFLEAMASNLPVVTTDDTIRREIVGTAGIFVKDPTDINQLSQALSQCLSTNWGNRPRLQAEKFSWDKIASKYLALFKKLI